ncbi:MAG: response regulator [Cytophagia bacterium]|nr:MAG: response regulator [Cytophagales bacterium]TAF99406.1 MAG: response regulator [Cytophagia bacterium]TAG41888.1 MAG: response regulator [Cytophagia bacterium]TAH28365.1 MAG: response regulator [Cytophagales bacterium]
MQNSINIFSGKKILVAEDDEINQMLLNAVLTNWKINFTMVNNGKEAVETALSSIFDIILLDIQMPILNGLEACIQIKKQQSNFKTPIIALSADKLNFTTDDILQYGFDDSLPKPIEIIDLKNILLKHLI